MKTHLTTQFDHVQSCRPPLARHITHSDADCVIGHLDKIVVIAANMLGGRVTFCEAVARNFGRRFGQEAMLNLLGQLKIFFEEPLVQQLVVQPCFSQSQGRVPRYSQKHGHVGFGKDRRYDYRRGGTT